MEVGWSHLLILLLLLRPRLLSDDVDQAAGANMLITASKERGGKPSLGASIAMDRLRFPVMMQVQSR